MPGPSTIVLHQDRDIQRRAGQRVDQTCEVPNPTETSGVRITGRRIGEGNLVGNQPLDVAICGSHSPQAPIVGDLFELRVEFETIPPYAIDQRTGESWHVSKLLGTSRSDVLVLLR